MTRLSNQFEKEFLKLVKGLFCVFKASYVPIFFVLSSHFFHLNKKKSKSQYLKTYI